MKIKDIKSMKEGELVKTLAELREKLRLSRFGGAGSKSKNVKEVANTRRNIARILTILNIKK
jgi:ribosomal protein L29